MSVGELAAAFDELKRSSFPDHPEDPDLADWILDLAELDGYIAGLVDTALGSSRVERLNSVHVAEHSRRLKEISVVGGDKRIYEACGSYIRVLQRVEDALGRL